jgi:hypothetical protein
MGGPPSQVVNARPSWYMIPVSVTLILLVAYTDLGKWDKITESIVLEIRNNVN